MKTTDNEIRLMLPLLHWPKVKIESCGNKYKAWILTKKYFFFRNFTAEDAKYVYKTWKKWKVK